MTPLSRIELLQQMPVFGAIRTDILEFLLARTRLVEVPPGGFYFHQGDPGDAMFVLESGHVEVLKRGADGTPRVLSRLGPGDCFGEMALIDLAARSASVRAGDGCVAIEITAANLMSVYEHDIEQFALIQMNMGREVSRRLREVDEQLFQLLSRAGS